MNKKQFSQLPFIRIAALAVGGFFLWKNRTGVQKFLKSAPWMSSKKANEVVDNGIEKLTGALTRSVKETSNSKHVS